MKEADSLFLATLQNKSLTNRDVCKLIQIWRDNHSKWNTFFSMGRWFKDEGMPKSMLDLVQFAKQLPETDEVVLSNAQAVTLYVLCLSRTHRNSSSYKDASSYSSQIYGAMMTSATYLDQKALFEVPVIRQSESERVRLTFKDITAAFNRLYPDQEREDAKEIKEILRWAQQERLTQQSYLTYFETACRINNQKRFFEILHSGGCFFARTRALGQWAATQESFLDLPNMDKLLGNTDNRGDISRLWTPYAHTMGIIPSDADPTDYAECAADFIMGLYGKRSCGTDEKYAPKGQLSKEGVLLYLTDILFWDNSPLASVTASAR